MHNTNPHEFPVALQPVFLSDGSEIKHRKAVVRTDSMNTLGIVSNSYGIIEHKTVVDSFREAGKDFGAEEKLTLTNNGANLFYEMTFPKTEFEVKKGDIVQMRIIAKNSYNGMNSLRLMFGAYRLVCLNGMILATNFMQLSYMHIRANAETDLMKDYSEAYGKYIRLFGERGVLIGEMAKKPVVKSDQLFSEKSIQLPKYLLKEAEESFEKENDASVWGYYNSLTYAITHKIRKENPALSIKFGTEAWKSAESLMN